MGNAEITMSYNDSYLECSIDIDAGKLVTHNSGNIYVSKREGTAVGCGGRFTFSRNGVRSVLYAYVDYEGKNVGQCYWKSNGLNLSMRRTWNDSSHCFVTIIR